MRNAWHGSAAVAVLMLAATANANVVHAQVYRGNDTGGIIPWSCENEAAARDIAADHCARYDKVARITSVHRIYGAYIGFNCLWRPDIAHYQIPAVRTRTTCYAPGYGQPRARARY